MFRTQSLPFTHENSMVDMIAPPPSSVSSPSTQMPTVFVHPPEEEQEESQPWCAFDASKENTAISGAVFTTPEMDVVVSKFDIWSQTVHPTAEPAPSFHRSQTDSDVFITRRDSLGPLRPGSSSNTLGLASIPESPKRHKERDDDDIIEVMKVRRSEGMPDVAYAHGTVPVFRKPKTLRSRAAQALRSIKNVGKVPRRPALEHVEHVFPAKENSGHTAPTHAPAWADKHAKFLPTQPSAPPLKKRMSQPLSNLFSLGQGNPASASGVSDAAGPTLSPSGRFQTMPHSRSTSATVSTSASTSTLHLQTDGPARPTSPSFSIRGTRHKFSFVNLQSIFSGNTTVPHEPEREPELEQEPVATTPDAETGYPDPELSRTVQTPVGDGWDSEEDYDSPRRHANLGTTMRRPADEADEGPSLEEQEFSFEMRLNSLHFDSFSFDADAF